MNLSNNAILITGGATGIGLELAKQYLDHGNEAINSIRSLSDSTG